MMCDFIKKFLSNLEIIISDIDYQKEELDKFREQLEDVTNFLEYVDDDIKKIGTHNNQKLIHENLPDLDLDVDKYQAMVYLVETDNLNIQSMPQYVSAVNYMKELVENFKILKTNLIDLIEKNNNDYEYKVTAQKYYEIFKNEVFYVEEPKEFVKFLLTVDLSEEDVKNILSYTIKNNVEYYQTSVNKPLEVDRKQELMKIHEIIHLNKNLMSNEYNEFMEKISKQVNLSFNIKDLINTDVLEKINIDNLILAKNIWLTNKISQNYKSCEFGRVSKYIKEYDELLVLKEKIVNINDKDEIVRIIKGGH